MRESRADQGTYSERGLHGQVVHELGRRVVSGAIPAGSVLPNEMSLGREFAISRTALREAIRVLAAKGLVESRTRTGTRVRPRSAWNMLDADVLAWRFAGELKQRFLRDLFEFRHAFEPAAAALAAARASADEIAAILYAYHDMSAAGEDIEAGIEPDLRFHKAILLASGNELMAPLGALIETALSASFRLSTHETRRNSLPLHKAVADAIVAREPTRARKAMLVLLDRSADFVAQVISTDLNPPRRRARIKRGAATSRRRQAKKRINS